MTKQVYRYDYNGYYQGTDVAFESPLEPGIYLIPGNCVETEPLKAKTGFSVKWNGSKWEYEEIPLREVEPVKEQTLEELKTVALGDIRNQLSKSDYKQAKFVDGALTVEEYEPIKAERSKLRKLYNAVEAVESIEELNVLIAGGE